MRRREAEQHLNEVYKKLFARVGVFKGSYIAGGSIASLILNEVPNDYDIWFETLEQWQAAKDLILASGVEVIMETQHAVTFRLDCETPTFQIIKSRLGGYDEVVEQFDFRHAHSAFLPSEDDDGLGYELVFCGANDEEHIEAKFLLFDGKLDYPTHTLSRLQKFALRGYKVPDQTLIKLILAIRAASPELINEDMIGVAKKYSGTGMSYDGAILEPSLREKQYEHTDQKDYLEELEEKASQEGDLF